MANAMGRDMCTLPPLIFLNAHNKHNRNVETILNPASVPQEYILRGVGRIFF